ncbi:hypothetical protein B0H14DRAFT_2412479 [Mycena olivaceomarginata]|nr:hypothetical protein B0H14DRAFT_2412479 [Mycena olivaceomarginata]
MEDGGEKEGDEEGEQDSSEGTRRPKWMLDGLTLLRGCPQGGSEWDAVVETWTQLEKVYAFQTSSANLPSPGKVRPEEVHQWLKNSRSTTKKIKVKSQEKLVKDWWKWWGCLAPAWRDKEENGVLKTGETKGEWGPLVHPGANGMLTVLLPLVWWKEGEPDAASESWLAAVRDVLWVLQGLLSTAKEKYVVFLSHVLTLIAALSPLAPTLRLAQRGRANASDRLNSMNSNQ